jgi:ketol-acid reductoisomerase
MKLDVYTPADADAGALAGHSVAVIGYGNLGSSMAKNLAAAGVTVVVGNRDDEYRERAVADGFDVSDVGAAVAAADVVYVLISDEAIPACFDDVIAPALRPGSAVCFASGYCLAYGLVTPPAGVDVLLLAPRMVGSAVGREAGTGYVAYLNVEHDASGRARERLLALALAAGALDRGAFGVTAVDEAALDLFVEQSVGPYVGMAIQLAFEVGVAAGLPPEALVLELYQSGEMAEVFRSFAERGFYRAVAEHGATAQYGGYLRSLDLDAEGMRSSFAAVLDDIRTGGFARQFQDEAAAGSPALAVIAALTAGDDPITRAEESVRRAMSGITSEPSAPAATGGGRSGRR